ncbi:MAG TPA: aminotransferase class III-fold pyridoxal phosphate-dependent enzyme, partial [Ramlibacter sp.]|nr:aminotransferase class III-fold pyridoxal phosphate-dependent enzyme [Ramlibacter sp.]
DARSRGLLGALELVRDKSTKKGFDAALQLPERIAKAGYDNGLIFRAFGDNILGFAPALCFTPAEFEQMFERLNRTLDAVLDQSEVRRALA